MKYPSHSLIVITNIIFDLEQTLLDPRRKITLTIGITILSKSRTYKNLLLNVDFSINWLLDYYYITCWKKVTCLQTSLQIIFSISELLGSRYCCECYSKAYITTPFDLRSPIFFLAIIIVSTP